MTIVRSVRLMILVAFLVATFSSLVVGQSERCSTSRKYEFKKAFEYGTKSFITALDQPIAARVGVAFPPIIIQGKYLKKVGESLKEVLDWSLNDAIVEARVVPALRIRGSTVTFSQGEVLFEALTIQEAPESGKDYKLAFFFTDPNQTLNELSTGKITFTDDEMTIDKLQFGSYGFYFHSRKNPRIPVSSEALPSPIPPFWLEVLNPYGYYVQESGNLALQNLSVDATASHGRLTPEKFFFQGKSKLRISNLEFFLDEQDSTDVDPEFTFTLVGVPGTISVSTGPNLPVTDKVRNAFMQFNAATSFFLYNNIGNTAVLNVAMPPIVLELYDSTMQLDASNTGLVVTASSQQGQLLGAEALFVRGVATFGNLMFTGTTVPRSAVITFTAQSKGNLAVKNSELSSGAIRVAQTAVKGKHLSFARSSYLQATGTYNLEVKNGEFVIPSIIVVVKDSLYLIDSTANGIPLLLVADKSDVLIAGAEAEIRNGIAAYTNLRVTAREGQTLRISVTDPSGIRAPVTSGLIMTPSDPCSASILNCKLTLQFEGPSRSFVDHEGQAFFATVQGRIPSIRLKLLDIYGISRDFPASSVPLVVAFTAGDPSAEDFLRVDPKEQPANEGIWVQNAYLFPCLQFRKDPRGLVRIFFRAYKRTSNANTKFAAPWEGISTLSTGFITVSPVLTPAYGLRFAAQGSLIQYPMEPSSAVVNIAMLPIIIELLDSDYELDTSNSEIIIAATSSAGELDVNGAREVMSSGRATFSTLRFVTVANEPVITFTALLSETSKYAVQGQTLETGHLTVSAFPIPEFEIAFSPVLDANNYVTYPRQPFVFRQLEDSEIRVSIIFRDSAHLPLATVTSTTIVEVASDEASLSGIKSATVSPQSRYASLNFSNRILGMYPTFRGMDVYFRYRVASSTNALLTDKVLVVGPIQIESEQAAAVTTGCSTNRLKPLVIGEFQISYDQFTAQKDEYVLDIANMMGIEVERVTLNRIQSTRGINHRTLSVWEGSKVELQFEEPFASSTNRKSSVQLAEDFVALRPGCDAKDLMLVAVYRAESDKTCDSSGFGSAVNQSEVCSAQADRSLCRCYRDELFDPYGMTCVQDTSLQSKFVELCELLSGCADSEIIDVCEGVVVRKSTSLVWVFAGVGFVVIVAAVLGVLYKKGYIMKEAATLHRTVDTQYRE